MASIRRVEMMWLEYEASNLRDALFAQRREMKKAFFCGVFALMNHLSRVITDETPEEDGAYMLESIRLECLDFFKVKK